MNMFFKNLCIQKIDLIYTYIHLLYLEKNLEHLRML